MGKFSSILPFRVAVLNCGLLAISALLVSYFPLVWETISNHSAVMLPITCGILIGAIGILSTVLVSIYSTIIDLSAELKGNGFSLLSKLEIVVSEIKQSAVLSVVLTFFVYCLGVLSPVVKAMDLAQRFGTELACAKYAILLYVSLVMFWLALDVVRSMFTLLAVAHSVYSKKYKLVSSAIKNTPTP